MTTTTTTTTPLFYVDFSVANQTIVDEFIMTEPYLTDEKRTKSASCDETSNMAIKFKEFDTTASLVLAARNGSIIFSKKLYLFKNFQFQTSREIGSIIKSHCASGLTLEVKLSS